MKKESDFGLIFWIHLIIILIAYLSPFLFKWQIVIIGAILLYAQEILIDGCILTHARFGKDKDMTFYYPYSY